MCRSLYFSLPSLCLLFISSCGGAPSQNPSNSTAVETQTDFGIPESQSQDAKSVIVDPDLDKAFQNAEWVDVAIDLQKPDDLQEVVRLQDPSQFKIVRRFDPSLNIHSRITRRGLENLLKLSGIKRISLIQLESNESQEIQDTSGLKKELEYVVKLTLSKLSGEIENPLAYRLLFYKSADKWDFLNGTKVMGNSSLFFSIRETEYYLEIWFKENKLFQGGFKDPLKIRYERELEKGVWEHKEFLMSETIFPLKIPVVPEGSEIRIYKVLRK